MADPQQAYDAFAQFRGELRGDPVMLSIEDPVAEEALAMIVGSGTAVRIRGGQRPRREYRRIEHANWVGSYAMRFFADGYDGLAGGPWYPDAADLDLPPEERGARWAAGIADEPEAVDEVLRIWADNGIVDADHYVFFHTDTLAESREDRAALSVLIETLGLQRLPLPDGAAEGEVWVRTDPRIEAEIESWA
ncbi:hypothetical protein [Microbacterium sediminis]|uniref:hypothetical protein n=1 Tax=Microbacterium sediminis TaxID=904291 RepID=UPI0009FDF2E9|nr:hypothetical protein [Microbacterium sediminis]QBR73913.1 hypothetical protein E3O41_05415 [Microbacterium sediminis]